MRNYCKIHTPLIFGRIKVFPPNKCWRGKLIFDSEVTKKSYHVVEHFNAYYDITETGVKEKGGNYIEILSSVFYSLVFWFFSVQLSFQEIWTLVFHQLRKIWKIGYGSLATIIRHYFLQCTKFIYVFLYGGDSGFSCQPFYWVQFHILGE